MLQEPGRHCTLNQEEKQPPLALSLHTLHDKAGKGEIFTRSIPIIAKQAMKGEFGAERQ